jgi:uncharacterized protein with PQ loop repeat
MPTWNEILGFAGTSLILGAYVPQMTHIVREHCSGGVSVRSWTMWLVATLCVLAHAATMRDVVFITLQVGNLAAITTVLVLIRRYARRACHSHESPGGHP